MELPPGMPQLARTNSGAVLLNKYELGKMLGRGSFAKVYAARAISSRELVAIKVIEKKAGDDASVEARIIAEVSAMKRVESHPNVLKIYEVMASRTKIYLVMELAVGGELFSKILLRGKLKEPLARKYFQQLVSALHFCHQNGVVHRDVKPQNLLLDKDGQIKLSDFGLSSLSDVTGDLHLRTACGTPAFSAPEVFTRRGYDGAKADAWSCGVMLYFFLTGCLPFDDGNFASMYKKIQRRDFQVPSWVSRPAKGLIRSLLDPNPTTRMTLGEVMRNVWFTNQLADLRRIDSSISLLDLDKTPRQSPSVNAFDIISMSSGLNLSGLFGEVERERRFTSKEAMESVMGKVREAGWKMGFRVEEGKGGVAMGWGKGRVALVFEALEIADRQLLVEIKLVTPGDATAFRWAELREGLGDIVLQWNN